jgi:hypothetical protein
MVVSFLQLAHMPTRDYQTLLFTVLKINLTLFTVLTIKLSLFTILSNNCNDTCDECISELCNRSDGVCDIKDQCKAGWHGVKCDKGTYIGIVVFLLPYFF